MKHILSLSYGKDSLACLGAIEKLGWPLDRIVHAEVWGTDTIPADLPPMVEFKAKADKIIKERYGIEVEHVCAMKNGKKLTYEKVFYRKRQFSKNGNTIHKMYGWPFQKGAWCNSRLKVGILDKVGKDCIHYMGIAADEPNRFHTFQKLKFHLLLKQDGLSRCAENGAKKIIFYLQFIRPQRGADAGSVTIKA